MTLVAALAIGGVVAVQAANQTDKALGLVDVRIIDRTLPAGGLSTKQLPYSYVIESLQDTKPVGYQIVLEARSAGLIDDFQAVEPDPPWSTEFVLDPGDMHLRLKKAGLLLTYPNSHESEANEIFQIAGNHGFYTVSPAGLDAFNSLEARSDALGKRVDAAGPVTIGVPVIGFSDTAANLETEWNAWISTYGSEDEELFGLAVANRDLVARTADLYSAPSQASLDAFNIATRKFNAAIDRYNADLGR